MCKKKKVTLIVPPHKPPDKPVCYCLTCVKAALSGDRPLTWEEVNMVRIVVWLEGRGHDIPEAPAIVIGEPQKVTVEPRPKLKKPKRQ